MRLSVALALFLVLPVAAQASGRGFSSDIAKTFSEAKRENKPILIDFYGIWCPPCNELDETVFESARFMEKAKAFKLLKVDADAKASWKLKDRYKIGGYPTVLFTSSRGKEIYRITGYRNAKEFVRVMDLVLQAKGKDLAAACKSKDTDDLWRCATICGERKDTKCADAAFKKLQGKLSPKSARYEMARSYAVETEKSESAKRDGYERLMKEMPASPLALVWAAEYLSTFADGKGPKPKFELVETVLAHYPQIASDPKADEEGLSLADIAAGRATLLDLLGRTDEARVGWREAALLNEREADRLPKDSPARGFTLDRIGCLAQGGDYEGALKLAESYRAKYPNEFTFHFWTAYLLQREKKYNDAIPVARKAYEASYGDNKIRAATLLVELLATIPDKESAKKVYDETVKDVHPGPDLEVRTHRYLKQLDEAMKKL